MREEFVSKDVRIIRVTDKAIRIHHDDTSEWVPRSQVFQAEGFGHDELLGGSELDAECVGKTGRITVTEYIAKEKGWNASNGWERPTHPDPYPDNGEELDIWMMAFGPRYYH